MPRSLTDGDRRSVLEILGSGSQVRLIGDPYPLGGYQGLDFGISREAIGVSKFSEVGSRPQDQKEIDLWALTFGKGLYYNVDVFLQFIPFGQKDQISSFGGGARWLFYEMNYQPVFFSLQIGANSASFQNLVNLSNQSADLLASMIRKDLTFYTGVGYLRSTGIFSKEVVSDATTKVETFSKQRVLLGVSYRWQNLYFATQVDQSVAINYSLKAGYRY